MTAPDMAAAALAAAGWGWPVFPLLPGRKRPRPELTTWETRATLDPDRIAAWWAAHPADNVAIATGPARLLVVDLDRAGPGEAPPPEEWAGATGGADVLAALADRHGQHLGATWTVATPSGGRHLYYRAPQLGGLRNSAGRVGWKIDTRAQGGYVVAAGSLVAERPYMVVDDTPPAVLPAWLAQLATPPAPPPPAPAPRATNERGYATTALRGEVQRVLDARPGGRNAALNRAAWNLARHIATGLLARTLVEDMLCEAGRAAGGQSAAGVAATVRSAIDARLRRSPATGAGQ